MATGETYGRKLLRFWAPSGWTALWLLLGLAPLFFFETLVHEGLHWITAAAKGKHPTLIPFAHFNTRFGTSGQNLNGAVLDTAGFVAMPQIVAFVLLIGITLIFVFTSPPWNWLRFILTWWFLGLVLDLLFNTSKGLFAAAGTGSDWGKFTAESGKGLTTFLAWLIWIVALSQPAWIAGSRWHINRPRGLGFFEFRVVAISLAFVSLIAIIVSASVKDPSIKRNWWYWSVFGFQLLSFLWYVVYVIWASVRKK